MTDHKADLIDLARRQGLLRVDAWALGWLEAPNALRVRRQREADPRAREEIDQALDDARG